MYLLIDMAEPKGHIRLNQFYIDSIGSSKCKVLCSDKLKDHYKQYDYLSFFSYNKSNKFFRLIKMLSILYLIIFKIKIKNIKKILFLSYDSIFIIPILYILKIFKIPIFSIEHNTVPISKRKKFLQKIIGNNINRLVYTDYIKNIYDNLDINSQVVDHPIRNFLNEQEISSNQISLINQISNNRKVVFCPSASVSLYKYCDIINQKSKNFCFVSKRDYKSKLFCQNVYYQEYFSNYKKIMELSDFIFLPFDLKDRVSGVFFEAISLKKTIIMEPDTFFYKYAKAKFPENIISIHDDWIVKDIFFKNIDLYNKKIFDNILKLLTDK